MKLPHMQDMSIDTQAPESMGVPCALGEPVNKYPYGLSISLGDAELKKLGLTNDCEVGEFVHLFCMAKVTGKSSNDTESGERNCVNLQITHMGCESEDSENAEADKDDPKKKVKGKKRSLYF